jgi:ArsR family transcriptional regulator
LFHIYEYINLMAADGTLEADRNDAGRPDSGTPGAPRWELYRLLSDPNRLRLLALASIEELAVSELAELLRESQPKVSRHTAALREAGLLSGRKQGTWLLLRLTPQADEDRVVADALAAGMDLCRADGSHDRVHDVVAARDADTREFFARGGRALRSGPPEELAAYLHTLAPLIAPRTLAIDAGTGDGALLEVLAPVFERVIAIDRSQAQIELAKERAGRRQFRNVRFVCGEIDGPEIDRAIREALGGPAKKRNKKAATSRGGADAVFAARVLHHAPKPAGAMRALVQLARPVSATHPGGAVLILDYESHRDEALREQQADLWLGFDPDELRAMAKDAGLTDVEHGRLPQAWRGEGPDSHIAWQWLAGRRGHGIERRSPQPAAR